MSYSIPIEAVGGRNGLSPAVNISYNSGSINGVVGYGWGIGGLSAITSTNFTKYYDGYTNSAEINLLHPFMIDGMRLVQVSNDGSIITYEPEQGNARIKGYLSGNIIRYFTVEYPTGSKATYGFQSNWSGQIFYPLTEQVDALGNYMEYVYTQRNNHYYISRINYGGVKNKAAHHAYLEFTYKQRGDIESAYLMGQEVTEDWLLDLIKSYNNDNLLRVYSMTYTTDKVSLLSQVDLTNGNGESLNPLKFYYGYDNNRTEELSKTESQLSNYFTSGTLDLRKGKFDAGSDDDGLMVFPKVGLGIDGQNGGIFQREKKWYFSTIHPQQSLLVYQGLNESINLAVTLTAGEGFFDLTSGDVDGKFGEDVIQINNRDVGGWDNVTFKVYQPNIYSGLALKYTRSYNLTPSVNFRGHNTSLWPKQYFTGDFNGDGRDEVFAVSMYRPLDQNYNSRCYLIDLEGNSILYNAERFNCDFNNDRIITMDYNGDGKVDILHVKTTGTDIYTFNNNQLILLKSTTNFKKSSYNGREMTVGDVNGDGKADILVSPSQSYYYYNPRTVPVSMPRYCNHCGAGENYIQNMGGYDYYCNNCYNYVSPSDYCYGCQAYLQTYCYNGPADPTGRCCPQHGSEVTTNEYQYVDNGANWTAYLSTGTDLAVKNIPIVRYSSGDRFILEDVNQDGKSDMVRINNGSVYVYMNNNGTYNEYDYKYIYTSSNAVLVPSSFANPDHHSFLMGVSTINGGKLHKINFSKNEAKQRLLTGVQNSRGVIQKNYYQRMNEGYGWGNSYGNIYTQGYGANFPYKNLTAPIWLTAQQETYLNNNLIGHTGNNYYNAVIHLEGLGFRGFEKITTYDFIKGQSVEQTFDPINKMGAMVKEVTPISETNLNYYTYVSWNKKITLQLTSKTTLDKLSGFTSSSSYSYDYYNNPTYEHTSLNDAYSSAKITNITYNNTVTSHTYLIGLPATSSVRNIRSGSEWKTEEAITYYPNSNLPQYKTSTINGNIVKQTQWVYDSWGNVQSEKSAVFGSGTYLGNTYEYDGTGRYVTKVSDPLGLYTTYGNYNVYGKAGSATDYKGNITTTTYNNWGRVIQINNPDGTVDYNNAAWANNSPSEAMVVVTESGTNKPTKKTYTDAIGREIRTSVTRFNGAELSVDKQYDYQGRLSGVSLPSTGTPSQWNTYQYDQYDRPTSITAANGNTVTYSYNGNSVTETKNKIATTKNMDGAGNVVSITDPGGTINYTLRPDGQPSAVTAPGGITTTFGYDGYGRRIQINDPSAGTKTFGYDQWGNTNMETDANGKVTNITYDHYGRVTNKTTPELSTTYTYNSDGLLQKEVNNNGTKKDFFHDNLGRTTQYKEIAIDGKWLQKDFTYTQGVVSTITYINQNGYITTETNAYQNGYLKTITVDGGTVIFDLQEENSQGKPTKIVSGAITRNYSYDAYGMPTGRSAQSAAAGVYMNQQYEFDPLTGNLNYRKDATRNITENFGYDALNRLTHINGVQTISYDDKGNITQKNGIGSYHYRNTAKPYAMTGIVQSGNEIPQRQQQVTYSSFSRPLTIAENGITAQFTYEAGYDRTKMSVTNNGALLINKYYLGDQYELDEKPGQSREKLYLGGDYYSAGAVLVRDNGGAWQLFYINSDYLGSITHIVNAAGQVVDEYSYDAWGRMRDPNTQAVYAVGQEPELFLGRGYTGHEHLAWFGLINMNARLYDPVHGRFLAPDPYVQAPDFTQSFNRYSYAFGNPLRYTDPSGEVFVIDDILIGAAIGALIGAATYTITVALSPGGFQNWNWGQFAKSVGIGAISGAVTAGIGQLFSTGALSSLQGAGEFFAQAGMHGLAQGGMSLLDGGNFWQGFASGALGSIGAATFGALVGDFASRPLGTIAFGALAGAIGAEATGGEWWRGAIIGGMVAGLNHVLSQAQYNKKNYILYEGDEIVFYENGKEVGRYPATSGLPGKQNSSFQNVPNSGPIPEGTYSVDLSLDPNRIVKLDYQTGQTIPGNGIERFPATYRRANGDFMDFSNWGTVRARLNPLKGTKTYGRSNFYLHNSHKGYSHGCIEVANSFFNKLISYRSSYKTINVKVAYPSNNTSTLGNTKR